MFRWIYDKYHNDNDNMLIKIELQDEPIKLSHLVIELAGGSSIICLFLGTYTYYIFMCIIYIV